MNKKHLNSRGNLVGRPCSLDEWKTLQHQQGTHEKKRKTDIQTSLKESESLETLPNQGVLNLSPSLKEQKGLKLEKGRKNRDFARGTKSADKA